MTLETMLHATAPLDDAGLRWTEMPLEDGGWCLHLGYVASGDPEDDGVVILRRIVLNTGQREVSLTYADLDRDLYYSAEEACREHWRSSCLHEGRL
jgi:hypothetical protein